MSLQEILSKLPSLTSSELEVVVATATALRGAQGNGRRNPARKPKATAAKKQDEKTAKPVSAYADNEDYKSFKSAEKALKVYLKESKQTLSQAQAAGQPHPALARFFEARSCWFRTKETLARKGPPPPAQLEPPPKAKGGEKKEDET